MYNKIKSSQVKIIIIIKFMNKKIIIFQQIHYILINAGQVVQLV